jgi:hypothetical protein
MTTWYLDFSGFPSRIGFPLRIVASSKTVKNPYMEGLYSAEFERSSHAELVEHLAHLLVNSVDRDEHLLSKVELAVTSKLKEAGLPRIESPARY